MFTDQNNHSDLSAIAQERLLYLQEIPAPTGLAAEIFAITADEQVELDRVVEVIEKSPEITMRILRYANSVYYGHRRHIETPKDAIIRVLGLSLTKSLMLAMAVGKTFQKTCPSFDQKRHWFRSSACAAIAQGLAPYLSGTQSPNAGTAYTAGLLHNFGVLALVNTFPDQFEKILADRTEGSLRTKTRQLLGIDHLIVGGWLARRWGLPENLIRAISFHDDPFYHGPYQELVLLTGLSCRLAGHLYSEESTLTLPESLPTKLPLKPQEIENQLSALSAKREELAIMAGLLAGG
ncbi:HDOD domain-containing protein [Desulfuromonas sp. AOP6]|uniref:HDOD domain-containing protein n=1 Tax=Desulfuromonas sp. AOP6 TaxID=1566351 RepID=UPI00128AA0AA|nr:HDOD domain-containing protein [Desulfuromonas sp. AOP6]BCA79373.1 hypothetical protein AOP6_1160 [Desulfuromonas sp. AOP6]